MASFIEPTENSTILDLGCDDGVITQQRFQQKITNPQIVGIDIEINKLQKAKKLGLTVLKADSEYQLPFKNNSFDIISANQLIEHLIKTDSFIKEIYRVLKPNGYLLISTENLASWHNIGALIMGWQAFSQHISKKTSIGNPLRIEGNLEYSKNSEMHLKIFTSKGLKEILETHNLKVERFFGAGYYPLPPIISNFFSYIDPIHSAFIGCKARKIK